MKIVKPILIMMLIICFFGDASHCRAVVFLPYKYKHLICEHYGDYFDNDLDKAAFFRSKAGDLESVITEVQRILKMDCSQLTQLNLIMQKMHSVLFFRFERVLCFSYAENVQEMVDILKLMKCAFSRLSDSLIYEHLTARRYSL